MAMPSLQSIGLSSPEEGRPSVVTDDEYDQGIEREGEGWSIQADYQLRRQLTRLHNVISCIQGNLEAVIRDPWLGRSGSSTEGYTSFGMFYFQNINDSDDVRRDALLMDQLESLPWVSRSAFEAAQEKTRNEQMLFIKNLREEWTFDDELEASRQENGPEWLVLARAKATYVETIAESSLSPIMMGRVEETPTFQTHSKLIPALDLADRRLPTIQDEGSNDEDDEADEAARKRSLMSRYYSTRQSEPFQDHADGSVFLAEKDRLLATTDRTSQELAQIDWEGFQSPKTRHWTRRQSYESEQSQQSYHTAVGNSRSGWTRSSRLPSFADEEREDSVKSDGSSPPSVPAHISDSNVGRGTRQSPAAYSDLWETPEIGDNSNSKQERQQEYEQQPWQPEPQLEPQPEPQPEPEPLPRQEPGGMDRMDRMERLLERLLIFSSEQALAPSVQLQQQPAVSSPSEIEVLRQEIGELRAQIQNQQSAGGVSPEEVANLRNEIAALRNQSLGLDTAAAADDDDDDSEPAIQQID